MASQISTQDLINQMDECIKESGGEQNTDTDKSHNVGGGETSQEDSIEMIPTPDLQVSGKQIQGSVEPEREKVTILQEEHEDQKAVDKKSQKQCESRDGDEKGMDAMTQSMKRTLEAMEGNTAGNQTVTQTVGEKSVAMAASMEKTLQALAAAENKDEEADMNKEQGNKKIDVVSTGGEESGMDAMALAMKRTLEALGQESAPSHGSEATKKKRLEESSNKEVVNTATFIGPVIPQGVELEPDSNLIGSTLPKGAKHDEGLTEEDIQCFEGSSVEEGEGIPHDPKYDNDFTKTPLYATGCRQQYEGPKENFLKGCKWSPDGTCLVTNSNDNCLRVFDLPRELHDGYSKDIPPMAPVLKMQEGELIYDYCWLPSMNSSQLETCCLASTGRDNPVHLWDAYTGKIRCSYRPFDHLDELAPAHSLAFSPDSRKLYCGFNKTIRVFDVERPGRDCETRPTYVKKGQPGIISCIAVNPSEPQIYAAGSYARQVAVYAEPKGNMLCMFEGQQGGVTHIKFTPDGNKLLTGGRKDGEILCWDLRKPGRIVYVLQRKVSTNQRVYFDMDSEGQHVVSGNDDGMVHIWDTGGAVVQEDEQQIGAALSWKAHRDMVNGISLHPTMPIVATASGQRHFPIPAMDSEEDSDTDDLGTVDNSLLLWWIGKMDNQNMDVHVL